MLSANLLLISIQKTFTDKTLNKCRDKLTAHDFAPGLGQTAPATGGKKKTGGKNTPKPTETRYKLNISDIVRLSRYTTEALIARNPMTTVSSGTLVRVVSSLTSLV